MMFLTAFILGGFLCLLFQIPLMVTKIGVPKLLIIGLFLGAVITVLEISDMLVSWGGAGFSIMVIGASQAIYNSLLALLSGKVLPILIVLSIFGALIILGLIAGATRAEIEKKSSASSSEATEA